MNKKIPMTNKRLLSVAAFLWNSSHWFLNQDPGMMYCGRHSKVCPQGPLNWNHADGAHWPTQWLVVMWHDIWRLDSASPAVSPRCCCRACPQGRIHVILKEVCLYLFCYHFYSSQMKRQFKDFRYCTTSLRFSLAGVMDFRFLRSDAFCFSEGVRSLLLAWVHFCRRRFARRNNLLSGRVDAVFFTKKYTLVWQKGCSYGLAERMNFCLTEGLHFCFAEEMHFYFAEET